MKSENQLTADKLKLEASGAGTIKLNVKANEITGAADGAGSVKLSGTIVSTFHLMFQVRLH